MRHKFCTIFNECTTFKIEGLWPAEGENKACENMTVKHVSSQLECQISCFESTPCVGISYNSHGPDHCRLCQNYNEFTQAPRGFEFFTRPSKYH